MSSWSTDSSSSEGTLGGRAGGTCAGFAPIEGNGEKSIWLARTNAPRLPICIARRAVNSPQLRTTLHFAQWTVEIQSEQAFAVYEKVPRQAQPRLISGDPDKPIKVGTHVTALELEEAGSLEPGWAGCAGHS